MGPKGTRAVEIVDELLWCIDPERCATIAAELGEIVGREKAIEVLRMVALQRTGAIDVANWAN